jgi:hypothetical protein
MQRGEGAAPEETDAVEREIRRQAEEDARKERERREAQERKEAAAREAQEQQEAAAREKAREAFLKTPAGEARSAFGNGDHLFQYSIDVMNQQRDRSHLGVVGSDWCQDEGQNQRSDRGPELGLRRRLGISERRICVRRGRDDKPQATHVFESAGSRQRHCDRLLPVQALRSQQAREHHRLKIGNAVGALPLMSPIAEAAVALCWIREKRRGC